MPGASEGATTSHRQWFADSVPLHLVIALVVLLFTARMPLFVWGDTWFNLVWGREVAQYGIIRENTLTAVGKGAPLVDVQWLAHLMFYRVERLIGLPLFVTWGALVMGGSIVAGSLAAVRLGAMPGRALLAAAICLMGLGSQLVLRAQSLAYPFLVAFPLMLLRDARRPTRLTWLLVPATVVWANFHGSVLLAPLFCCALLVGRQVDFWRASRPADWSLAARDALLACATALSVFVTPYGGDVVSYYGSTAGNTGFRDFVTEWYPMWDAPEVGIVALFGIVVVALLASWRRLESFVLFALGGVVLMAVMSVRHTTPLALVGIGLFPFVLGAVLGPRFQFSFEEIQPRASRLLAIAFSTLALGVMPLLAAAQNPAPALDSPEAIIAATAKPGDCLFIEEQHTERMLWYYPQLRGIVAHGVRFEILPAEYIQLVGALYAGADSERTRRFLQGFDGIVLDERMHADLVARLQADSSQALVGRSEHVRAFRPLIRLPRGTSASACTDDNPAL
jgi:hypothetical protein